MTRGVRETYPGALTGLLEQVPLECDGLLHMEKLEVSVLRVGFKTSDGVVKGVNGLLVLPVRLFQEHAVLTLDALVVRVVLIHQAAPASKSLFTDGLELSPICRTPPVRRTSRSPRTSSSFVTLTRRFI